MNQRVVPGRPAARGKVPSDANGPGRDTNTRQATSPPRRNAPGRVHRVLGGATAALGVALSVAVLVVPLLLPFTRLAVAWWIVVALATILLVAIGNSAVSLSRGRQANDEPPLRRAEPDELDFDAPWHAEADA